MSARVTDAEVRGILRTTITDLTPFITTANALVNSRVMGQSGMSEDLLKQVELWLAAHFAAIRDPQASSESAGGVSASYMIGSPDKGLNATPYGQQAVSLDISGSLAKLTVQRKQGTINMVDPVGTRYPGEQEIRS